MEISRTTIALVFVGATLSIVGFVSPASLPVFLIHGSIALAILLAAAGLGISLLKHICQGTIDRGWTLLGGTGLGLGFLSLLVLGLGSVGLLGRNIWLALLVVGWALFVWHVREIFPKSKIKNSNSNWLWLLSAPFLAGAILAASIPPGILWVPEGNGYDVLEYHLGAPRDFLEAGRIAYLPNNIYSNLPFNVEMLYLLCMIVRSSPIDGAAVAQMLNVLLGVLAIGGVWLAGSQYSRSAGLFAGICAAVCPFVAYVSGIAYVENGVLLFNALSVAAVLHAWKAESPGRWVLVAGLFAGLACGCKYPAGYAVVVPIALCLAISRRPGAARLCGVFLAASMLTLSPWLIRNTINTGSPVFPLARSVFHERPGVWNDERAAHWEDGHLPAPGDRPLTARLARLGREVFASQMFGPIIIMGCLAGVYMLTRRDMTSRPIVTLCLVMILIQLVAWTFFTHMTDRFAITLLIPTALILGIALDKARIVGHERLVVALVIVLGAFNMYQGGRVAAREHLALFAPDFAAAGPAAMLQGQVPGMAHIPVLNKLAAECHHVWVVADACGFYLAPGIDYTVVFNRNPFAEAAARGQDSAAKWLRENNYDYLYVDWSEMNRLRNSRYGFWPSIDLKLFEELARSGDLSASESFRKDDHRPPYSTLFRVTRK